MSGLFDTFGIALSGLSVSQSQINTTSHNIANADTTGYARQSAIATTTAPSGGNSKFDDCTVGQVGTGAQISSIERIRDSFLDYQVRDATTKNSAANTQNDALQQVDTTLDETGDTGIEQAVSDFYDAFSTLSGSPEDSSDKQVAISKAETLASEINDRYTSLGTQQSGLQDQLGTAVTNINSELDQVNDLNKQIQSVTSLGLTPNDLMDQRDNLLDQLSSEFGISVNSKSDNGIDLTTTEMASTVGNLVSASDTTGASCSRFSTVNTVDVTADGTGTYTLKVNYSKLGDSNNTGEIEVTGMTSSDAAALQNNLQQSKILVGDSSGNVNVTGSSTYSDSSNTTSNAATLESKILSLSSNNGDIGGNQAAQQNIQECMNGLDKFAASFAYAVNAIETGSTDASATNTNISNNDPLFVVNGSSTTTDSGISAGNITVNSALVNDSSLLNCGASSSSGEADGTRALAISDLRNFNMDLTNIDSSSVSSLTRSDFFSKTGLTFNDSTDTNFTSVSGGSTLEDNYTTMINNLNTEANSVSNNLTTTQTTLTDATNQRTSVSGVSLDEEMTNLIQYQHAYEANAKVISTVDSLLDVVINGLTASS